MTKKHLKTSIAKYLAEIGAKGGKASKGKPRKVDPELRKMRALLGWKNRKAAAK